MKLTVLATLALCACGSDKSQAPAPKVELDDSARAVVEARRNAGITRIDFSRVFVIGASVSAGFGGAAIDDLLDEAIKGDHEITGVANVLTSRDPVAKIRGQVDKALQAAPTVVIALDALFWYVYVSAATDHRLERLDIGLRELARVRVPIVVGDIPYMRDAHPIMIRPSAIPTPAELTRFNDRIRAWAKEKPHVHIVPMSKWVEPLLRGESVVEVVGEPPVPASELMSVDKLHPNRRGLIYMLRKLDAELEAHFPKTPADALQL